MIEENDIINPIDCDIKVDNMYPFSSPVKECIKTEGLDVLYRYTEENKNSWTGEDSLNLTGDGILMSVVFYMALCTDLGIPSLSQESWVVN